MAEEPKSTKKTRAKNANTESTSESSAKQAQPQPEAKIDTEKPKPAILATGLEDYGRWKAMFKDHSPEKDPPFRRGRIWS